MRIVLDTNSLIQSFSERSPYFAVWMSILKGENILCVSNEIMEEYAEILQRLDPSAQLVLVNAVAFDAKWAAPYEKSQIKDGSFTNADGSSKTVPMMTGSESDYLEQDGAVGFLRYYDGQYP